MLPLLFEKTILKVRAHPIVLLFSMMPHIVLLITPPLALYVMNIFGIRIQLPETDYTHVITLIVGSVYYLYILLFIFYTFFDYFLDLWIITDHHIINIEQQSMFMRTVSKEELDRVQDVTSEIKGLFGTIFNFGDVTIQTAGSQEHFVFENVQAPQTIVDVILRSVNRRKEELIEHLGSQPTANTREGL